MSKKLTIVECPRDAMQGMPQLIPVAEKVSLLKAIIAAGFKTVDFGSFVSPKAVPQMADTLEVLKQLNPGQTNLLAIIANLRGAETAVEQAKVAVLGYPLSISETFQQRNSNKSIVASLEELVKIIELTNNHRKELVVYLSMAFGNPYNDPYSLEIVREFAGILASLGVRTIAISDTVGLATPGEINELYRSLIAAYPAMAWGLHLHARPEDTREKVKAALEAGCRRLDGAILGFGGCPMAKDDLVGNINTRLLLEVAEALGLEHGIDHARFTEAERIAGEIYNVV